MTDTETKPYKPEAGRADKHPSNTDIQLDPIPLEIYREGAEQQYHKDQQEVNHPFQYDDRKTARRTKVA